MSPTYWLPSHPVEILLLLVGLTMGVVFSLSSWRGSSEGIALWKDPRVRALMWGLTGFLVPLFGQWDVWLADESLNKARLLAFYGIPFLGIALLTLASVGLSIFLASVWLGRGAEGRRSIEPFTPVLDYLHYGYAYYRQRADNALYAKYRDEVHHLRQNSSRAASLLAAGILAVDNYRQTPLPEARAAIRQRLLENICLVIESYTQIPQEQLNANLMVAIPFGQASSSQREHIRFAWSPEERYGHILLLREYAYPRGQENFALPVEDPHHTPDWLDLTLPGAPEAFLRQTELVVETPRLDFATGMPQNIRRDIEMYFVGKTIACFACLVIPGDAGPRGIVNIESGQEHVFRRSQDIQSAIVRSLHPFCALLGLTILDLGSEQ